MKIEADNIREVEYIVAGYKWAEHDLKSFGKFSPENWAEDSMLRRGYELYMAEYALIEENKA